MNGYAGSILSINLSKISPTFFALLMEHNLKKNRNYEILSINALRLNEKGSFICFVLPL